MSQEGGGETHVWDYREGEKGKRGKTTFGDNFWESWDNNGDMKVGINGKYNIIT